MKKQIEKEVTKAIVQPKKGKFSNDTHTNLQNQDHHERKNDGKGTSGGFLHRMHDRFMHSLPSENRIDEILRLKKHFFGNQLPGQEWIPQQIKRHKRNYISGNPKEIGDNMGEDEHLVFIEPSPHEQEIQQLEKNGGVFEDESFPASSSSLVGRHQMVNYWDHIEWKKATEVFSQPKIFKRRVQPLDIMQGYLGDCYFLAGLAALSERPDRIFDLFLVEQINKHGYYNVKILFRGKWRQIIVDDYFPFLYKQSAFSKSNNQELWVMVLEKAWAKLYGSYKQIEAGFPEEPLHDLTGAPIKHIFLNKNPEDKWQEIVRGAEKQFAMVAASNPGRDSNKSPLGIAQGHAYTLLHATQIKVNKKTEKVVQLRNPWGNGQNTGKWADKDPICDMVTKQQKQRVGFTGERDDGIFFMAYTDFCKQFRSITIAEIDDDASYVYISHFDPEGQGAYFSINVNKPGLYSLQVDKTPERSFTGEKQANYRYPRSSIQLAKIKNNKIIDQLPQYSSAKRMTNKWYDLETGNYICFVKTNFDKNFQEDFQINLAIYSEHCCSIQIASKEQARILHSDTKWKGEQANTPQRPPSPNNPEKYHKKKSIQNQSQQSSECYKDKIQKDKNLKDKGKIYNSNIGNQKSNMSMKGQRQSFDSNGSWNQGKVNSRDHHYKNRNSMQQSPNFIRNRHYDTNSIEDKRSIRQSHGIADKKDSDIDKDNEESTQNHESHENAFQKVKNFVKDKITSKQKVVHIPDKQKAHDVYQNKLKPFLRVESKGHINQLNQIPGMPEKINSGSSYDSRDSRDNALSSTSSKARKIKIKEIKTTKNEETTIKHNGEVCKKTNVNQVQTLTSKVSGKDGQKVLVNEKNTKIDTEEFSYNEEPTKKVQKKAEIIKRTLINPDGQKRQKVQTNESERQELYEDEGSQISSSITFTEYEGSNIHRAIQQNSEVFQNQDNKDNRRIRAEGILFPLEQQRQERPVLGSRPPNEDKDDEDRRQMKINAKRDLIRIYQPDSDDD